MQIQPFRIHFPERVLDDLYMRLLRAKPTDLERHVDGNDWAFGTSAVELRHIVAYWLDGYDWRAHEAELNAMSHFRAELGDLAMHFVHERAAISSARPLPILLLHGWPDSFLRYHKVVRELRQPGASGLAFDVVVPSLPGFGFTGPVALPKVEPLVFVAERLWRLMTQLLGYDRFVVAGGDGGSPLAQLLAIRHPESVIAIHLTDLGWHVGNVDPSTLTKPEQKYLADSKKRFMKDGAYAMLQTTRPRSIATSLNDSPVGLASWIIDRFHAWKSPSRTLSESFGYDDLLTNIMIYWATETIGSSMYSYYADRCSPSLTPSDRVERPVALALFPDDIGGIPPRAFAERTLRVERWTEMPRGGHFAALEEPALYAADVREFFGSVFGLGAGETIARESTGEAEHVHAGI